VSLILALLKSSEGIVVQVYVPSFASLLAIVFQLVPSKYSNVIGVEVSHDDASVIFPLVHDIVVSLHQM
jgi:hypothetical protein